MAIETLSDDVLLEILDLYPDKDEDIDLNNEEDESCSYDAWYALAHVCRRWRYVVFESPRRLNLRLHCTSKRRVREMLGVWPALPIVIWDLWSSISDEDNIVAALEHRDRVCEIKLRRLTRLQLEKLMPLMQESFPALTKLQIESHDELLASDALLVLPDSFLGGSAPHLRFLCLESISFPAIPNLLRSASNLVYLYLHGTPSRYISPEMVAALSALTKLEVMHIFFHSLNSDSDLEDRALPLLTRSVLPALKSLVIGGNGEYLDDFVALIDVPSINSLRIYFFNRLFFAGGFFHLPQFIGRIKKFRLFDFARFDLSHHFMDVTLQRWTRGSLPEALQLKIFGDIDGPLPSLVEACNTLLPLFKIDNFHISSQYLYPDMEFESTGNTEDRQWLEVLRPLSGAKSLYLGSMDLVPPVALALKQVVEEGMTDVLPAIRELTISKPLSAGPAREAIEQFVTARGLSTFGTPPFSKWRISARGTHEGREL